MRNYYSRYKIKVLKIQVFNIAICRIFLVSFYFYLLSSFFSCTGPVTNELIVGKWKCVKWTRNDKEKTKNYKNIYFRFYPDKTYSSLIRTVADSGSYSTIDSNLYVTSQTKMELCVKILQLTDDSLVFLMNNGGIAEQMTLLKEK